MRTPAEFRAVRSKNAAELEVRIDKAIDGAALAHRTSITVAIGEFAFDIVEHVMADYRRVGWKVQRVSDSRDGDYIELVPP